MSMNIISGVTTWDDVASYIDSTMGISYTDNPTAWVDAMYELTEGYKYVKTVNDVTGEVTNPLYSESLVNGVGEFHTGTNTSAGAAMSGGGVKSMPTAKSIITENTGGGTAVITDEAIGVKDIGVSTFSKGINVFGGLFQIYGLVTTGIEIANAQVWKDMSNYVYATNFDNDTPLDEVISFLKEKAVATIHDLTDDTHTLTSYIPDSIAQRMYEFLSNHMIVSQTPGGIHPRFEASLLNNFIQRDFWLTQANCSLDRYMSVTDYDTRDNLYIVNISDDMFKYNVKDYIKQLIGAGFTVSNQVATALIASMSGIWQYLKTQSVDAVENATFLNMVIRINRGSSAPPKTTPLSLSEFYITIDCCQNTRLEYYAGGILGDAYAVGTFYIIPGYLPSLDQSHVPNSYTVGDCIRYLKRGFTGGSYNDYGYFVELAEKAIVPSPTGNIWTVNISYPSNEQSLSYTFSPNIFQRSYRLNGYCYGVQYTDDYNNWDIAESVPANSKFYRGYSNMSFSGYGESTTPDDYLLTAGFRVKTDSAGNPDTLPNPNKTKEEVYPELANKKQVANPQARVESGAVIVDNQIIGYVPTSIPFGNKNAETIINHGVNNTNDPDTYVDNRPQTSKLSGFVNTNDPVEGFNDDVADAIDQYNQSRQDPAHYPEPIPENETNPQYPSNPPADTTGDTGDNPDPATGTTGVTASGMVSVYNPTKQEVIDFSAWLWSPNFFDNFIKLLQNPLEAIIGLHVMYATPITGSPENIVVGYLDSGVSAKVVTQQYFEISCGSVTVPEYYGTAIDYEPYTSVHLYLPFVGIQAIKANDVIGKKVTVTYGIDTLTGACLAMVTTEKGNSKIQCYTFPGNCAVQIPLTGGNYAQVIRSIASVAVGVAGSILTANPLPAIGGVVAGAMGSSLDVSHSGSLGSNVGVMGVRKPYFIITRRSGYDAGDYNQYYGYPANKTVVLGTCQGFTRVKSVHIETIGRATDSEKSEMETLLKQGVIIK